MNQKEKQMVEQIMNTEAIGYAYLYPAAGGQRKGYLLLAVEKGQKGYLPISGLPCTAMGMGQSSRSYMSRKPLAASIVTVSIYSNAASCPFQLKFNYGNIQVK